MTASQVLLTFDEVDTFEEYWPSLFRMLLYIKFVFKYNFIIVI